VHKLHGTVVDHRAREIWICVWKGRACCWLVASPARGVAGSAASWGGKDGSGGPEGIHVLLCLSIAALTPAMASAQSWT